MPAMCCVKHGPLGREPRGFGPSSHALCAGCPAELQHGLGAAGGHWAARSSAQEVKTTRQPLSAVWLHG